MQSAMDYHGLGQNILAAAAGSTRRRRLPAIGRLEMETTSTSRDGGRLRSVGRICKASSMRKGSRSNNPTLQT
jgi:hypothetical protein